MAAIVTTQMRIYAATLFLNGFSNPSQYVYLFIGNTLPWNNENAPPTPIDCVAEETAAFQTMMSLKLISPSNVSLVIPRNIWTTGTIYGQYSNTVDLSTLNPSYYVISDQLNVYKCLGNNVGGTSTVQPTGTSTSTVTLSDGYQWKYMYTVSPANVLSFVTNDWIPVSTLTSNDGSNQWMVQQAAIPGTIDRIDLNAGGSQYVSTPTVTINGDGTGATAIATISAGNVTGIIVTATGSGYTTATVSITGGGVSANGASATPIVSPLKGHGADATLELGGYFVLIDQKFTGSESGSFTIQNDYRRIGIIQNPILNDGANTHPATALDYSQAYSLTFSSVSGTQFNPDETVTGLTSGATGIVEDWDGASVLRLVQTSGTFTPGEAVAGAVMSGVLSTIAGTAQSGSTNSIVLANSASSVNSTYNGQTIKITSGTGIGQIRQITAYVGLTRTATVSPVFSTAPDSTSTYVIASIFAPAIVPNEGNIIYLENRRPIMRSADQSEDVKIVIEF